MNVGRLKIKNGWWKAAGNVFGWVKDGYHVFGVGINKRMLLNYEHIKLEIKGRLWQVSTEDAINFIQEYKSVKKVGEDTELGVVSKSILTPLNAPVPFTYQRIPGKIRRPKATKQIVDKVPTTASMF